MKDATVREVALRANVSTATVSRVVHGKNVRPGVRERVEAAMADLRYKPNLAARTLRSNASRLIACAIRGLLMPEMAPFLRAAERTLREAGYTLLLTSADERAETQKELIDRLVRKGVDGLLFTPTADSGDLLKQTMQQCNLPTVLLDRDAGFQADAAVIDHRHGIAQAVRYLVSLGHRRIGLLTLPATLRPGRERIEAFREAAAAAGLPADAALICDECLDAGQAYRHLLAMMSLAEPPTALISGGMTLLGSVLKAARVAGLEIPRDLSLVAGCDSELAELAGPGITAVRWDTSAWGEISAQLMLERIAGRALDSRQVVIPTELVLRGSCAPPGAAGR